MATLKDQIAHWNLSPNRVVAPPSSAPAITEAPARPHEVEALTSLEPALAIKTKASQGVDYYAIKVKLHQKLLTRIDLNAIEILTPEQLRNELGLLLVGLIEEDDIPAPPKKKTTTKKVETDEDEIPAPPKKKTTKKI